MPAAEPERSLRSYLDGVWRHKFAGVALATLLFATAVAVAMLLPPVYKSSAIIQIQQQEIPQDFVRSTVTVYADQRIQTITQRVMTTSNLLEVINKFSLYEDERRNSPLEEVIEQMREDISFEVISAEVIDPRNGRPTRATLAFQVGYDSGRAVVAQRVANELASLYLNENLRSRQELASETSTFLSDEAAKLEGQVQQLERQLAEFKEANAGRLPELTQLNLNIIERLDREIIEVDRQIRAQQQSRAFLATQLASLEPTIEDRRAAARPLVYTQTSGRGQVSQQFLEAAKQLEALETQYSTLTGRYGARHPDVVRTKREIAALRAQVGAASDGGSALRDALDAARAELRDARQRYADAHPDVKRLRTRVASLEEQVASAPAPGGESAAPSRVPNPSYVDINARLQASDAEIAALKTKREDVQAKLEDYETRLTEAPQVEREYRNLTRDYEQTQNKFQEVKAKQLEAELAVSLESEQKGERFTLIEPPQLPQRPASPNRPLLAGAGGLLAVLAGLALALLLDLMDGKVRGARMVAELTGGAPLATIPYIDSLHDRRRKWGTRLAILLVIIALGAVALALVDRYVTPLDVLWYSTLNRIEARLL